MLKIRDFEQETLHVISKLVYKPVSSNILDCQYGQPICSLSPIVPCCRRFTQPHLHCHL
uniref:Uncharacterized protein n=1 Tax=Helianthus annuus TaxID=4232 RepID=A0A251TRT8_HELAN